jgi:hypothetical protein
MNMKMYNEDLVFIKECNLKEHAKGETFINEDTTYKVTEIIDSKIIGTFGIAEQVKFVKLFLTDGDFKFEMDYPAELAKNSGRFTEFDTPYLFKHLGRDRRFIANQYFYKAEGIHVEGTLQPLPPAIPLEIQSVEIVAPRFGTNKTIHLTLKGSSVYNGNTVVEGLLNGTYKLTK